MRWRSPSTPEGSGCSPGRSEPFFADIEGALHGFQWTGHDEFPYLGVPNA
jgi:hypothetical protein